MTLLILSVIPFEASLWSIAHLPLPDELREVTASYLMNNKVRFLQIMKDPKYSVFVQQMIVLHEGEGYHIPKMTVIEMLWRECRTLLQGFFRNSNLHYPYIRDAPLDESTREALASFGLGRRPRSLKTKLAFMIAKLLNSVQCKPPPISAIWTVPGSTVLSFAQCYKMEYIPYEIHETLRVLDLQWTKISSLEPLRLVLNLEKLVLIHTEVSRLEPLRNLKSLEYLDISHSDVVCLEPLSEVLSLQTLIIKFIPVTDLEPLAGLINLRALTVHCFGRLSLKPLRGLAGLGELDIAGSDVESIKPLLYLVGLKVLMICKTLWDRGDHTTRSILQQRLIDLVF